MATIQENVDTIIAEAIERAEQAQNEAVKYSEAAVSAASALATPSHPGDLGSLSEPTLEQPDEDYAAEFFTLYNATKNEILASLDSDWTNFLNTYFPAALNAAAQAWILNAIQNGGTGIAAAVEDAIHQRGRDRIDAATLAAENQVADQYARLGWAVPPGFIAARLDKIRQEARTKVAEVNRDVIIKAADQEQDNVQFAIRMSIQLIIAVWDAAANFIDSVVKAYDPAVRAGDALARHTEELYNHALAYYKAKLSFEELEDQHELTDINIQERYDNLAVSVIHDRAKRLTDASMSAAKMLGEQASSALQGQNTLAAQIVEEAS